MTAPATTPPLAAVSALASAGFATQMPPSEEYPSSHVAAVQVLASEHAVHVPPVTAMVEHAAQALAVSPVSGGR